MTPSRDNFARHRATLVGAAVVAVATWPVGRVLPTTGPGSSWMSALARSTNGSLSFGRDLVYPYGPLGYLDVGTLFDSRQWFAAMLFKATFHVVLAVYVMVFVRRMVASRLLAVIIAFALMCFLATLNQEGTFISVLVAVIVLDLFLTRTRELPLWVSIVGGALVAVTVLFKLNEGLTTAFIIFVFCPTHAWSSGATWRRVVSHGALAVSSAIASTVILWLALAQPLHLLPAYLRYSIEIVSGYADGLALETGGAAWQLLALAFLVGGLGVVLIESTPSSPRRRLSILVIVAGSLFGWYKHAFVRHNSNHAFAVFAGVLVLAVMAGRRGNRRTVLMLATQCIIVLLAVAPTIPLNLTGARRAVETARLLSPSSRDDAMQTARQQIRIDEAIPASFLARMRDQTVHFEPTESVIAWAYPEIQWRPLPVFDTFNANTSTLDHLNAEALVSTHGPDLVLYENFQLDDHASRFTSPETQLDLLCYFDEIDQPTTPTRWALFARRQSGSNCGPQVSLPSIRSNYGDAVPVPTGPADAFVIAEFHGVGAGPVEFLRGLLYKPPFRYIAGDGSTYRFVSGTASQPHVLRLPACLANRLAVYPSQPFESVRLTQSGSFAGSTSFSVSFSLVPFRC